MIRVAGIIGGSIVDGPGMRTCIFCQGCPHHCPGCHNPETWDFSGGTPMSTSELYAAIKRDPLSRGVTFSGGEPFAQVAGFAELAERLKKDGYEIASYSGYTFDQLLRGTDEQKRLLSLLDVLIDGPFLLSERSLNLTFKGSRNQRTINVPASLESGRVVLIENGRWVGEY